MTTEGHHIVPLADVPAFIKKHARGRAIYVWLEVDSLDSTGGYSNGYLASARKLGCHLRVTVKAACQWVRDLPRARTEGAHVLIDISRHSTLFIG